jgi:uncharacterized membrane protein
MTETQSGQTQVALRVASTATQAQNEALRTWLLALLDLRERDAPRLMKAKDAIAITAKSKVVWPLVTIIAKQAKKLGWDERSSTERWGLGGVAIGLTLFSGQSAGVAALGTAVGVPLWIVLGAGSMFARLLYAELLKAKVDDTRGASYKVIDAEREEP